MTKALLLATLVVLVAARAATAGTPAQYRATVNSICRPFTPKFKAAERAIAKGQKTNDQRTYRAALGKLLAYDLAQDRLVEAVPVPPSLRAQMSPIFTRLAQFDVHVRAAIARARAEDDQGLDKQLIVIVKLVGPLNAQLDAAGLRDCGSAQA